MRVKTVFLLLFALSCTGGSETVEEEHKEGEKAVPVRKVMEAGAEMGIVGPGFLKVSRKFPGEVVEDKRRAATLRARFPGVVKTTYKLPGDPVRRGEVVARIESDQSMTEYPVVSPINGYVGRRYVSPGEAVEKGEPLYDVLDLSWVWVRALAYPHTVEGIRRGMEAYVVRETSEGRLALKGKVLSVSPEADEETRLLPFIIAVKNDGSLRPGMFVDVLVADSFEVPLAVPKEAVHTLEGDTVVFRKEGDVAVPVKVSIGRAGDSAYEVLSGLKAGDTVFVRNSFVIKAEIEKKEWEGEGHEH